MISGHLNCFPGAQSRFVYDELEQYGVFDLVRNLSPSATRMPNIGCNLNLPNSSAQNPHAYGYSASPFLIVNVVPIDTDLKNGAMEVTPGTHSREYKYWQYALSGKPVIRRCMSAGDVIVRSSMLWHRGMPNMSNAIRPTWENGGSNLTDRAWREDHLSRQPLRSEIQRQAARARFCLTARAGNRLLVHALFSRRQSPRIGIS